MASAVPCWGDSGLRSGFRRLFEVVYFDSLWSLSPRPCWVVCLDLEEGDPRGREEKLEAGDSQRKVGLCLSLSSWDLMLLLQNPRRCFLVSVGFVVGKRLDLLEERWYLYWWLLLCSKFDDEFWHGLRYVGFSRMNSCDLVLLGEELFETLLRSLLNFDRILVDHIGPGDEIISSIDRKSSHGNTKMIYIRCWIIVP